MTGYRFGASPELQGRLLTGYDFEALVYDAWQGLALSRELVLSYASERLARGEPVEPAVQRFVGDVLRELLAGKGAADVLRPLGHRGKPSTLSPVAVDIVALAGSVSAGAPVLGMPEARVRKQHAAQSGREHRLALVGEILARWYRPHKPASARRWHAELRAVYAEKADFDKHNPA